MSRRHLSYICTTILCGFAAATSVLDGQGLGCTRECHGIAVEDKFAWLEDSDDIETEKWLDEQTSLFERYIDDCSHRSSIKERLTEISQHEHYEVPQRIGGNYFFLKRLPTQEQSALYVQEGADGAPRMLFDPQSIQSEDIIAIDDFSPSSDSRYAAIGLKENGSDWITWKVLDTATAQFKADIVQKSKFFRVVWSPDSQGFYYSKFGKTAQEGIFYHALGTTQNEDLLVFEDPAHAEHLSNLALSSDDRYLVVQNSAGCDSRNGVWLKDLADTNAAFKEVVAPGLAKYVYLHNQGSTFFFLTDKDAPLGKIISFDLSNASIDASHTFIAEGLCLLETLVPVGDKFVAAYQKDSYGLLKVFDLQGTELHSIDLPEKGTVYAPYRNLSLVGSPEHEDLLFGLTNFIQPTQIYRYHTESRSLDVFKAAQTNFSADDYIIKQVFYASKDGTRVPMSIVHRKGLVFHGDTPTLLYGYGGFEISIIPEFNPSHCAWIERGGVLAIANIRGGSEYGQEWHLGGAGHNKQNCFDDFIAAAEWLIENEYTSSSKLAIQGRSNGGLLVAACVTQRPDLFGAASVEVGVLDMLRFHLFTVGWAWTVEFGNPDDPEDFAVLYKYSPYHNLRKGTRYPSTLVSTAKHDDRVVPLHSFKFTAALQEANAGPHPALLRLDTKAGHGCGRSVSQEIDEWADIHSFLLRELGVRSFE